jgi:hypothetical protein
MSDEDYDMEDDDTLTTSERATLNSTTTPQERAIIIKCTKKNDEKCRSKMLTILRNMFKRGVDLNLINKYVYENFENREYEIVYEFVDQVKREGQGIKRRKGTSKKRKTSKRRKTQGRKRSRRR